jgi:hypothetical protein
MMKKSINSAIISMIHVNATVILACFGEYFAGCDGFAEPQIMDLFQHVRLPFSDCACSAEAKVMETAG